MRKAQTSVEYLLIISVALLILIPVIYYANKMLIAYEDDNKISSAKNTVRKLGESVDWVFSQGSPAKLTVEIYIPKGVEGLTLNNKTINFQIKRTSGISDVYYETIADLTGTLPTNRGYYYVAITAYEDSVGFEIV